MIRKKNYNLVANSTTIMKKLNQKLIFYNIDNDLTEMYLHYLEETYTTEEIILIKKTLENEISSKASIEATFVAVISVVIVLTTTVMTNLINSMTELDQGILIALTTFFPICYIVLLFIDFFGNQKKQIKRVKLLNHINLLLALKESDFVNSVYLPKDYY